MVPARRTSIVVISLLSRFGPQQIAEAGSVEWLDQHRLKTL
jgi:hypothetical protein